LGKASIRQIYQSQVHPELFVIDQINSGKAGALNSGIGFADADLVCCVDADTIPERDCLLRAVIPILENPH
jgi:cellulose synthase/poly-beta-1,6-N-acetylglucosamine synthase-like glycosyltransferase